MNKIVIVGATSGIGKEVALLYIQKGWRVGIAGRREEELKQLVALAPDRIEYEVIDITQKESVQSLSQLVSRLGGMDLYLHSSGIGKQNQDLEPEIEINTVITNGVGFTRMITAAFNYFKQQGKGHLAVISSIAGTKGMGGATAYSATKRFQNTYMDGMAQLTHMEKLNIHFTDIRPGFVATALLKDDQYPLMMEADYVAKKIVKALDRKKRVVVIDWKYRILVFFWRLIPQWLWERIPVGKRK